MISVKDLIEGRKNDFLSPLPLCGRLNIITKTTDDHQRGSILLSDILAGDTVTILCQVDQMSHDLENTLISISRWTSIDLGNGRQYLQFTLDSVKRMGYSTTHIDEKLSIAQILFQHLKDSTSSHFSCLHPRQLATSYPDDIPHGVTLAGLLCAKSNLYQSCFFAELMDIHQPHSSTRTSPFTAKDTKWTVPVVFKGDHLIKYYMELQVGRYYLFNNLEGTLLTTTSTRQQPKQIRHSMLSFKESTSSFLEVSKQKCEYLLSTYNPTVSSDVDMSNSAPAATTAATTKNDSETPIKPLATPATCRNNLHHYTGVVTRVIDSLFGVYELDEQILLCLFHYIGYSESCPYHVGTKLKVTHAHVLSLDSLSTVSPILDMDWNAPRMTPLSDDNEERNSDDYGDGDVNNNNNNNFAEKKTQKQQSMRYILVACMRSDVRIDQFLELSDNANGTMDSGDKLQVGSERHIEDTVYTHCIARRLTFAAMVRQLELFASMKKKFGQLLGGGDVEMSSSSHGTIPPLICLGKVLIEVVFSTTGNRSVHGEGDIYGDFFEHGVSCLAVNESTNATGTVTLDAFPTLQHLMSTMINGNKDGDGHSYKLAHGPLVEIPPTFVTSHADVTRYCFDAKTKDTAWVVGLVEALPDGQVYFMDDTYRVKLLVTMVDDMQQAPSSRWKNTDRLQLGHVYIIKRFHLVVESLTLTGMASTLEQQYMMCSYRDMKDLGPFASSIPTTINNTTTTLFAPLPTKKEDLLHLSHFHLTPAHEMTPLDIAIYSVLEIMQTTMVSDNNGVVGLEKWVRAIRYGLGTMSDPTMVYLVFTSRMNALSYAGHLQVGSWFGLTLMDDMDQVAQPADRLASSSSIIPIYLVDRFKHQFYPIVYQHLHSCFNPQQQQQQQINMIHICPVFDAQSNSILPVGWDLWKYLALPLNIEDAIDMNRDNNSNNRPTSSMFTLHGTVLFKGFIIGDDKVDDDQSTTEKELFQRLGVGVGRSGVNIFLRIQQVNGLETTDIYLRDDLHHLLYFLGVVPGNKVTLFRVSRKRSYKTGKVYFVAGVYTYIEVYPQLGETLFDDLLALHNNSSIPQLTLDQLHSSFGGGDGEKNTSIFKAAVSIQRVEKIKLQWICTLCGMEWYQNKCSGNCDEDGRQVFRAEAKVQVTDGTSIALAMIDGEVMVFRLLMLQAAQEETLKQAALMHGSLECGFWVDGNDDLDNTTISMAGMALRNGMTLADLANRIKLYGKFYIYGKRYYQRYSTTTTTDNGLSSTTERPRMEALGLQQKRFDPQDPSLRTLVYPIVKIKVESLEILDPVQEAWKLVERLSTQ